MPQPRRANGPGDLSRLGPTSRSLRTVGILGALLAALSPLWEYVRMRPDYGYLVEPWALRGLSTAQGRFTVAVACLGAAGLLALSTRLTSATRRSVTLAAVILPALLALVFDARPVTFTAGGVSVTLVSSVTALLVVRLTGEVVTIVRRSVTLGWVLGIIVFLVTRGVVVAVASDTSFHVEAPLLTAAVTVVVLVVSVTSPPRIATPHRLVTAGVGAGAVTVAMSAGALRTTLVEVQTAIDPVAARYVDTQITSGYFLAVLGLAVLATALGIVTNQVNQIHRQRSEHLQLVTLSEGASAVGGSFERAP